MENREVTASSSHAVLISEIADLRRELWMVIAVGKQVAHTMPNAERARLLDALMQAERKLLA